MNNNIEKEVSNKFTLLYASAGSGKRFGSSLPKQFYKVFGIPLFIYPLLKILLIDEITEIVFIINKEYEKIYFDYIESFFYVKEDLIQYFIKRKISKKVMDSLIKIILRINIEKKRVKFCYGGNLRQESIYNGLLQAKESQILIYESSRPFIKVKDFIRIIEDPFENITYADDIRFTVVQKIEKKISKEKEKDEKIIEENPYFIDQYFINGILNRESLCNIQLPQKFNKRDLILAHEKAKRENKIFTDDSSIMFNYGKDVKILKGNPENIKITYKEEIEIYKKLFKKYLEI